MSKAGLYFTGALGLFAFDPWRPEGALGDSPALHFFVPMRTKPLGNLRRTNTQIAAILSAKEQRALKEATIVHARRAMKLAGVTGADLVPCIVAMGRLSSARLDDDGLASALKRVRDGIAAELGIDDGSRFIRFRPRNLKAPPKTYGVEIVVWRGNVCTMWGDDPR